MDEQGLKDIQIIFDKEAPQKAGTEIEITALAENNTNLEYKFIIGQDGVWTAIKDFSKENKCIWKPKNYGQYTIMVQARKMNKKISLDHLAKEEYSIIRGEVMDYMGSDKQENEKENVKEIKDIKKYSYDKDLKAYLKNKDKKAEILDIAKVTEDEKKELINTFELINLDKAKQEAAVTTEAEEIKGYSMKIKDDNVTIEPRNYEKTELEGNIINKSKANDKEAIYEEDILAKDFETKEENESPEKSFIKEDDTIKNNKKIIDDVCVTKEILTIGEKCTITINTLDSGNYLYRFYERKHGEWSIIREYDTNNSLTYTANECGKKELLIECKSIDSKDSVDDFRNINLVIEDTPEVEIKNIKCCNDEILAGEELRFEVQSNVINNENKASIVLYKFYKISKSGKSTCIQDYSTSNVVNYVEEVSGEYRLLCLARTLLSNKEYDDRALLVYNVKPYKEIKIESFVASLNSPQATETAITVTSEITGGRNLLYRYRINGPIEEDTGYVGSKEFTWVPTEPGEYEIILYVKDESNKNEYEDSSKIAFTIEKRGNKPIKILDVVVDKGRKTIVNENVNVLVKAEGATSLLYSFIIRKDNGVIDKFEYSKANWFDFIPDEVGEYEIEILIKDKYSEKTYDTHTFIDIKALEYLPGEVDCILLPCNAKYLIGDTIELECISENTENVLVKYETKINGHSVEETDFCKNKKLRFTPKSAGKYTIEVYAKNVCCTKEYDTKNQINIYVNESAPVIDTKITPNTEHGKVNEEFSFDVTSRGGKDVCYEFYLMQNNNWTKVQSYSKKSFYSFIPFVSGNYRILALAKSYYKKVNYEDYAQLSFVVKES